jgi:hypothetical protein
MLCLQVELNLAYFPYFEKSKEAYEITLLSACPSPQRLKAGIVQPE